MRAFVAVFPPLGIRTAAVAGARETVRRLGGSGDRVRWARPENVHLTLKFLGNARDEILGDLRAALEKVCAGHEPFDVELAGLGAFPSARRARILWVGIDAGFEELRSLAANVDVALVSLGFERENRPYTPHLTLGRIRGRPASFDLLPDAGEFRFRVRRVELVESTLTPEGSVYRTVGVFALRGQSENELEDH